MPKVTTPWSLVLISLSLTAVTLGCATLFPGLSDESDDNERLRELMEVPDAPDLIRQAAIPHGLSPVQVDGVGLVTQLPSTGGAPDPSGFRDQLIEELKRDSYKEPNGILERNDTSLVRVRAIVPPGARRGDLLDLRLLSPASSRATNLHSGFLEKTRLRHQQVLDRSLRQSDVMLIGQGAILTQADFQPHLDETLKVEGTILRGGIIQVDRPLGLVIRPEFEHAKMSANIASAINKRFFFFDGTTRRGIAKAIEDDFVQLDLHPRYHRNVYRMMEVVRAIGMNGSGTYSQKRLTELAERLANPATAADAAIRLEAMGESAIPTLVEGTRSDNAELRYYAAEALAYLDREEAILPLEEAVQSEPAFRHDALLALQELPKHEVVDALTRLMGEQSLETRYGAFCALRQRDDGKSVLLGRELGSLKLYRVPTDNAPVVIVSIREQPEVVMFGNTARINLPGALRLPTGGVMLIGDPATGTVRISRHASGELGKRTEVDSEIGAVIAGIASVGGSYGDVVAVLRICKDKGYLSDQLAIDPLPRPLRTYHREDDSSDL